MVLGVQDSFWNWLLNDLNETPRRDLSIAGFAVGKPRVCSEQCMCSKLRHPLANLPEVLGQASHGQKKGNQGFSPGIWVCRSV